MQLYQSNLGISSLKILLNTTIQNFWFVLRMTLLPAFIRITFPVWQSLSLQCLASTQIYPSQFYIPIPYSKHSWIWPPPWGCEKTNDCDTSCVMLWNVSVSHWQISNTFLCFSRLQVSMQLGATGLGHLMSSAIHWVNSLIPDVCQPSHKGREKSH